MRGSAAWPVIVALSCTSACSRDERAPADPHAHHRHAAPAPSELRRSEVSCSVPPLTLRRHDGVDAPFPRELDDGRPVLLDFVFTSCTAICPVLSQVFAQVQKRLGAEAARVHLVSISIDPEHDTEQRLAGYARRFEAGPSWQLYTGRAGDIVTIQKAFVMWRGDKMNHTPATFVRRAPGQPWVRLDGFATPDDLLRELRR